jgi:hypothetical protein
MIKAGKKLRRRLMPSGGYEMARSQSANATDAMLRDKGGLPGRPGGARQGWEEDWRGPRSDNGRQGDDDGVGKELMRPRRSFTE